MLEELPKLVRRCSALQFLYIYGDRAKIERIPDCIKDFHELQLLSVNGCSKLASLPELPGSLNVLVAESCKSLETVSLDFDHVVTFSFLNCFNLGREARRVIQQSLMGCLPGRKVPAEFDHRALGNSLTIRSDFSKLRFCVVVSPKQKIKEYILKNMWCRVRINKGCLTECDIFVHLHKSVVQAEHLCFSYTDFVGLDGWLEQDNEIMLEFITCQEAEIIECGLQIRTVESERRRRVEFDKASKASLNSEGTDGSISSGGSYEQMSEYGSYDESSEQMSEDGSYDESSEQMSEDDGESLFDGSYDEAENRMDCWSWLLLCLDLSSLVRRR